MTVVGIIPAAGSGERLGSGGPKAFVVCGGRPLLDWSLDVLRAVCDHVVVAVPASVAVVHDAARPLVTEELVRACIAGLEGGYDAAIAAAPMTDTVKETDPD